MSAVSGQFGLIKIGSSNLQECTGWTFDRQVSVKEYGSCETGEYTGAVSGRKRGSGTLKGIYDPDDPIDDQIEEGDSATLLLYTTASKFYTVPAIIGNLALEVDIETGDVERWTASFTANGQWTNPS